MPVSNKPATNTSRFIDGSAFDDADNAAAGAAGNESSLHRSSKHHKEVLEQVLDGIAFPTSKLELIDYADGQKAGAETMTLLRALPEQDYDDLREINQLLGKIDEPPGSENLWPSRQPTDDLPGS